MGNLNLIWPVSSKLWRLYIFALHIPLPFPSLFLFLSLSLSFSLPLLKQQQVEVLCQQPKKQTKCLFLFNLREVNTWQSSTTVAPLRWQKTKPMEYSWRLAMFALKLWWRKMFSMGKDLQRVIWTERMPYTAPSQTWIFSSKIKFPAWPTSSTSNRLSTVVCLVLTGWAQL